MSPQREINVGHVTWNSSGQVNEAAFGICISLWQPEGRSLNSIVYLNCNKMYQNIALILCDMDTKKVPVHLGKVMWVWPTPNTTAMFDLLLKQWWQLFYARWVWYTIWFRSHKKRWGSVDLSDSYHGWWMIELGMGLKLTMGRRQKVRFHLCGVE